VLADVGQPHRRQLHDEQPEHALAGGVRTDALLGLGVQAGDEGVDG
jgi:hypothetical protein